MRLLSSAAAAAAALLLLLLQQLLLVLRVATTAPPAPATAPCPVPGSSFPRGSDGSSAARARSSQAPAISSLVTPNAAGQNVSRGVGARMQAAASSSDAHATAECLYLREDPSRWPSWTSVHARASAAAGRSSSCAMKTSRDCGVAPCWGKSNPQDAIVSRSQRNTARERR